MKELKEQYLHQLSESELSTRKVSLLSEWNDKRWIFDERPAGNHRRIINWSLDLPDGSNLTDDSHKYFLDTVKRFIWSLKVDPPSGSKRAKPGTLVYIAYNTFDLIRWMLTNSYKTFSELNPAACEDYCNYVSQVRRNNDNEKLQINSFTRYTKVLVDLYRQRNKLPDAIVEHPFRGRTAYDVAKKFAAKEKGWIPYIPDQIALASLHHMLEWLEWRAHDVIQLIKIATDPSYIDKRGRRRYRSLVKALEKYEFSTSPDCCTPWHPKLQNLSQLRSLIEDLIIVCANTILGLVGLRGHELLGLEHDCVEIKMSIDGLFEVFYIVSRTSKTVEQVTRWVAGTRLVGTEDVPLSVKAIQIIEMLLAPWRDSSASRKLFISLGRGGLTVPKLPQIFNGDMPLQLNEITIASLNKGLNKFHQKYVPLSTEWHFTSHQWRKTFARFVAKTDKSALAALSQHFLHVSVVLTDRDYIGNDFELEELIDEITRANTADILIEILLKGKPVAGRMGEELMEKHTTLKTHFQGMTVADVEVEIRWIVEDSGMLIHSCEWGWCMYRQETSQCEGSEKGPNSANREPSICSNCSNLMVEERHRLWWQDRLDRNANLIVQLNNTNAPELQKAAPQARVRECQKVINMLNSSRDEIDVTTK